MGRRIVVALAVLAALVGLALAAAEQRLASESPATLSPAWSRPPAMEAHVRRSFPH